VLSFTFTIKGGFNANVVEGSSKYRLGVVDCSDSLACFDMAKEKLTPEQALQLIAMSLGTDELKNGLNLMLHFAHQFASDNHDWDLVDAELGHTDYDVACLKATEAWIKRVTGFDEFERAIKARDKKK
jgi:hypothetical protein